MKPEIIFECPDYLIINKPNGLMVHGDGRRTEPTLTDWLLELYPDIAGVGEEARVTVGDNEILIDRPGIVHRLDAETSGVMVVARTPEMYGRLKKQFHDRQVTKTYRAVVHGAFKQDRGTIDVPIGEGRGSFQMRATGSRARGELRPAQTTYRVMSTGVDSFGRKVSVLECLPKTGRTHQIRVHMLHVQHPILSDPLYCPRTLLAQDRQIMPRLALHAARLAFFDAQGVNRVYEAPIPPDLQNLLDSLEK